MHEFVHWARANHGGNLRSALPSNTPKGEDYGGHWERNTFGTILTKKTLMIYLKKLVGSSIIILFISCFNKEKKMTDANDIIHGNLRHVTDSLDNYDILISSRHSKIPLYIDDTIFGKIKRNDTFNLYSKISKITDLEIESDNFINLKLRDSTYYLNSRKIYIRSLESKMRYPSISMRIRSFYVDEHKGKAFFLINKGIDNSNSTRLHLYFFIKNENHWVLKRKVLLM